MKANEAPEKLYIPFEDEIDRDCLNTYAQKNTYHKEIEYTRTDAFIEKAAAWIKNSITNNPECNRIISKKGIITMGAIIEDFRKYMKEE